MLTPTDEKYRNYTREELAEANSRIGILLPLTCDFYKIHGSDTQNAEWDIIFFIIIESF